MATPNALQPIETTALVPMVHTALQELVPAETLRVRFASVIVNQLRTVPNLQRCTPESVLAAVTSIVQLDLDPALPNEVSIVPFWNKQGNCYEAQRITGFGGLKKLALRHRDVLDIFCAAVHERDTYVSGDDATKLPMHKRPDGFRPRGKVIGYYAAAKLRAGYWRVIERSKEEIAAHKQRYSLGQRGSFWDDNRPDMEGLTNFDKMALKTCLRELCHPRNLPQSVEYMALVAEEYAPQNLGEQDERPQGAIPRIPDMTEMGTAAEDGDSAAGELFGTPIGVYREKPGVSGKDFDGSLADVAQDDIPF